MSKQTYGVEFENLRKQGPFNDDSGSRPDKLFASDGFFDPADLAQVKYEMLRRVAIDGVSIREATKAFGLSRQTFYQAKAEFERGGVDGLSPFKHDSNALAFAKGETAISRKSRPLAFADDYLRIDLERRTVRAGQKDVRLTRTEFTLLQHLVSRAGKLFPHQKLEQLIWGRKCANRRAGLRVYINQLRKKIEPDPVNPTYIVTEPLMGYRFAMASVG